MSSKTTTPPVIQVNTLVWITSLAADEQGVTRRVLEDLEPRLAARSIRLEEVELADAAAFGAAVANLAARVPQGIRPVLHLDVHGSPEGLVVAANGERIGWADFCGAARALNVAMGNDLLVVGAACFGFAAIRSISILEASPFFVLLGPDKEIPAALVEERTVGFYETLIDGGDIAAAHRAHLTPEFSLFHCERAFALAYATYLSRHVVGAGGARRREALLTEVVAAGKATNRSEKRRARSAIKVGTRPDPAQLEGFRRVFLAGRRPAFGISELLAIARRANARPQQRPVRRGRGR